MALAQITVLLLAALAFQTPLSASAATLDDAAGYWGQSVAGATVTHDQPRLAAYAAEKGVTPLALALPQTAQIWVGDLYDQLDPACQRRILFHEYGHLVGLADDARDPRDTEDVMVGTSTCGPPDPHVAVYAAVMRQTAVDQWRVYDALMARRAHTLIRRARCRELRHSICGYRFSPGPLPWHPTLPRPA